MSLSWRCNHPARSQFLCYSCSYQPGISKVIFGGIINDGAVIVANRDRLEDRSHLFAAEIRGSPESFDDGSTAAIVADAVRKSSTVNRAAAIRRCRDSGVARCGCSPGQSRGHIRWHNQRWAGVMSRNGNGLDWRSQGCCTDRKPSTCA